MNVAVRPQSLDILSICTGGGGLDLGIELAVPGARSVCLVEREAFAVAHLVAAMEQGFLAPAPVWSDARTFDGRRWRGCVDGLIGGIPCQPHSLAGRKRGSLDERDLWSDARRIIVQSRCWFVLIENVGGMLSAGADEVAGAERVWRDLRKLGFAVEIGLFTAAEVGASHERERVFILGVADAGSPEWRPIERGRRFIGDRHDSRGREAAGGPQLRGQDVSCVGLADAFGPRLEGIEPGGDARPRCEGGTAERDSRALGTAKVAYPCGDGQFRGKKPHVRSIGPRKQTPRWGDAERCDHDVVDAALVGRGEGWAEPSLRSGRGTASSTGEPNGSGAGYLFPPGPSDRENWKVALERAPELEPAFRRVADGLASRLDFARVDRLRMLGNGVVPLQAAFAFRTLAERLARKGHDRLWKLCQ